MLFLKRGERVQAEAEALAVAAHPGVVELVGVSDGVLQTRMLDAQSLAELGPLSADEVAGVAAAAGTTLADLHDLGVVHGGVEAGHVLVCSDGRLVLCSLGRGGDPADDVAALGRLVTELLAAAPAPGRSPRPGGSRRSGRKRSGRLGAMLSPAPAPVIADLAAQASDPDPSRRPTARAFAGAVHQGVPGARVPLPRARPLLPLDAPAHPPSGRLRLPRRPAVVHGPGRLARVAIAAVVMMAGTGAAVTFGPAVLDSPGIDPRPPATARVVRAPTTTTEPVATRVWPAEPLAFSGGVLTVDGARYAVGQPGDALAAGDWGCAGRRTLALLRPATGEVFAFDGWAGEGEDLPARPLGRVGGGTGVRAVDHDGDGCDDLEVERAGRPPVHMDPHP